VKTYNGWTNYETWNVALWLDNEPAIYNYVREIAGESANEYDLAVRLQTLVEDMAPELDASMFADLLGAALNNVEWSEIARNILSES